jgi:hypothetical protein
MIYRDYPLHYQNDSNEYCENLRQGPVNFSFPLAAVIWAIKRHALTKGHFFRLSGWKGRKLIVETRYNFQIED